MRGSSRAFYAGARRRWFASVPAFGYHSPGAHRERAGAERGARARDRRRRRLGPARRARGRAPAPPARRAAGARADGVRAHGGQRTPAGRNSAAARRRPPPRGPGPPPARPGAAERVRLPLPARLTRPPGASALLLARGELLVLVRVHEVLELRLVLHLDLHEPALVVGVLVDDRGVVLELGVDGRHRPGERREQLRHGAHGLELAERLALLDLVPYVGQLDGDDLAELGLAVLGDAQLRAVALDAQPQAILGELWSVPHR